MPLILILLVNLQSSNTGSLVAISKLFFESIYSTHFTAVDNLACDNPSCPDVEATSISARVLHWIEDMVNELNIELLGIKHQ